MTSTSDPSPTWDDRVVTDAYRAHWGRLLSLLVTRTRRFDLAEEALGEAFARASARWPIEGTPANVAGWLYTTAWRLIVGRLRAEEVAGRKIPVLAVGTGWVPAVEPDRIDALDDERLQLILLCCHPALHRDSQSALALRLVVGTSTEEIARLCLVSSATMAARITRAKKKIVVAGIPLASPIDAELRVRLDEVCRTIYLAFTAGYAPGSDTELMRADLAGEAVELAEVLNHLVPRRPQVQALLALLLLQHARRDARVSEGRLVTLPDQNRSRWHHGEIAAGLELLASLEPTDGYAEELRLQALIAGEHSRAAASADTDWSTIASHYLCLETLTGSPIVRLNRAVAVAEADGPVAGLDLLEGLETDLPGHHRVFAVQADLARRAGLIDLARTAYAAAIELCQNQVERAYLTDRLARLTSEPTV